MEVGSWEEIRAAAGVSTVPFLADMCLISGQTSRFEPASLVPPKIYFGKTASFLFFAATQPCFMPPQPFFGSAQRCFASSQRCFPQINVVLLQCKGVVKQRNAAELPRNVVLPHRNVVEFQTNVVLGQRNVVLLLRNFVLPHCKGVLFQNKRVLAGRSGAPELAACEFFHKLARLVLFIFSRTVDQPVGLNRILSGNYSRYEKTAGASESRICETEKRRIQQLRHPGDCVPG
jgi:hypothetical protein